MRVIINYSDQFNHSRRYAKMNHYPSAVKTAQQRAKLQRKDTN